MQTLRQTGWMVVRQARNLMREPIWIAMMVIQPLVWLLLYGQLFSHVVRAGITAMLQALLLLVVGFALGVRVHGGFLGWLVVFAATFLLAAAFAGFSHGVALLVRKEASMIATANFVGLPLMFISAILIPTKSMP